MVILIASLSLSACQNKEASSKQPPANVKEELIEVIDEGVSKELKTKNNSNTISPKLVELLSYIPADWADQHLEAAFVPTIYLLDIEAMRTDLNIPSITGADSRKDKLDLILGLSTQGLDWKTDEVDPMSGGAFDEWGWDVADIGQVLHSPDVRFTVLLGNFERPEIRERLTEAGYEKREVSGFELYSAETKNLQFAWKEGVLVISTAEKGSQIIEAILAQMDKKELPGLQTHPSVESIVSRFGGIWGAVLSPSPDWTEVKALKETDFGKQLSPEMAEKFDEMLEGSELEEGFVWDIMAITFRGVEEDTLVDLIYHYPSESVAQENISLVEKTLTETPSMASRRLIWGEKLTLEDIEVDQTIVVAHARTQDKELIGQAISHRDYYAFLPVR